MVTPYVVAARKYRPKTLQQLIGQSLLVQALTAAFTLNRIPHAFILTGIRGVGKTTTARILAAGLNCSAVEQPTLTPCGQCAQCVGTAQGNHPDIIEIDAASNNGVDNVREIVDSVRYKPVDARYRVFIIDEVHMLSKAAFNALLKTLEEPPPHAIFILATTELNKVPVTVLSRCRRLQLRRVDAPTLQAHLLHVCQSEGFTCANDAAMALALAADGSVRDALSLLDQAIACAETTGITRQSVDAMLGLCSPEAAATLLEHICAGNPHAACQNVQQLLESGLAARQVLTMLLDVCTALLKISAQVQTPDTFLVSATLETQLRALAQRLSVADVMAMWQITAALYDDAQHLPDGVNILEHLVLRLSYANTLPPLPQLLQQLQGDTLPVATAAPAYNPPPRMPPAPLPPRMAPAPRVAAPAPAPMVPAAAPPSAAIPPALANDSMTQSALRTFPHAVITLNPSVESTADADSPPTDEDPDV